MQRLNGFTLLEVVIVLALTAILLATGLPAYFAHVEKSRQRDAVSLLQQNALFLEAHYQETGSYKANPTTWPVLPHLQSGDGQQAYRITFGTTPRNTDEGYYLLKASSLDGEWALSLTQTGVIKNCRTQGGREVCSIWQ